MNFAIQLAAQLIITVLVAALNRRRPVDPPRPTIKDVKIPNSQEGQPLRIPFGTPSNRAPFVAWYDNLELAPIVSSGGKK